MAARPSVTASQDGHCGDREFVVACKGRPFTILTPTSLPTPTVTYLDHKLVAELKLRMSDLQCSRLHYGSKKLRILGRISTSVQCIEDGNVSGNLHMKAMVVENLCEHFDVHSIAGIKMNQLLNHYPSLDQDTTIDSDEPTRSPPKKKKKKKNIPPNSMEKTPTSTPSSTPARAQDVNSPSSPAFAARRIAINAAIAAQAKKSPDPSIFDTGYPPPYGPVSPILPAVSARMNAVRTVMKAQEKLPADPSIFDRIGYPPTSPPAPVFATEDSPNFRSPRSSPPGFALDSASPSINISRLNAMGGVTIAQVSNGAYGPIFYPGHGPKQCLPSCRSADPPMNCGYNEEWFLPTGFQMCGPVCRGAFCGCLRDYNGYGYYG